MRIVRSALVTAVLLVLCSTPTFASDDDVDSPAPTPLHATLNALKSGARTIGDLATDTSLLSPETPNALRALSVSYFGLSLLDWATTTKALATGAGSEQNALMAGLASHPTAFLLTKVAATGTVLYVTEHMRKRNPMAAHAVLAAVNSAMLIVVAHNASVVHAGTY